MKSQAFAIPARVSNGGAHVFQAVAIFYKAAFLGEEFDLSGNLVGQTFKVGLATEKPSRSHANLSTKESKSEFCLLAFGLSEEHYKSIQLKLGTISELQTEALQRPSQFEYEFRVEQPGMNRTVKVATFQSKQEVEDYSLTNGTIYSKLSTQIKMVGKEDVFDLRISGQGHDEKAKVSQAFNRIKTSVYACPKSKEDDHQPTSVAMTK